MVKKFYGKIDGVEYDDYKEFFKALSSTDSAKNVVLTYNFKNDEGEGVDEQADKPLKKIDTDQLYPQPNLDETIEDPKRLSEYIELLDKMKQEHSKKITMLDMVELQDHISNLETLMDEYRELGVQNGQAVDAVLNRIRETEQQKAELIRSIAADKNKIHSLGSAANLLDALVDYYHEALEQSEKLVEFYENRDAKKKRVEEPRRDNDQQQNLKDIEKRSKEIADFLGGFRWPGLSKLFKEIGLE